MHILSINAPPKKLEKIDVFHKTQRSIFKKIYQYCCSILISVFQDILITAGGENIAPVLIEQTVITKIPVVSNAVLVADGRKFVSVLITLKVIDSINC